MIGSINLYVCATCRGHMVTRDLDEGTTPFITSCFVTEECKGSMQSSMYRVSQVMRASFEWYRPDEKEIAAMHPHGQDHVRRGGLVIRPVKEFATTTIATYYDARRIAHEAMLLLVGLHNSKAEFPADLSERFHTLVKRWNARAGHEEIGEIPERKN